VRGDVNHRIVVKVQSRDCKMRARANGFFFYAQSVPLLIKVHDAISLWILHPVSEDRGARSALGGDTQLLGKSLAVEDVIAQYEGDAILADESTADYECLSQPFGSRLL